MANINSLLKINATWTQLKSVAVSKGLPIQYDSFNTASAYDIFCLDGNITYVTVIFTGPVPDPVRYNQTQNDIDKADFVTNYKDIVTNRATAPIIALDGYAITTANPNLVAGSDGSFIRTLRSDTSGRLIVVGLGTAGTPSGGVISIQGVSGGQPIPISGSVTATNAAVSTVNTAAPASASYTGGSVTTAAPSYSNNTMNALSLTTSGLLRIDGSGVTQPISAASLPLPTGAATETTLTGVLTTTAFQARVNTLGQKTMANSTPVVLSSDQSAIPVTQSGTWTVQPGNTANTTPWLTTISQGGNSATVSVAGALKIDGSAVTQPVSGTVTANAGTGNFTVVQATAGNLNATVVGSGNFTVVQGTAANLRAQTASESATGAATPATAGLVAGAVTTAAPTYTTGNLGSLSLTTSGLLRVDGSGVTQPVSGTITANIGTTNGLALDATLAKLTISQGIALGTNTQAMVGGSVTTAAPTYTTGNINPLSLTTAGALRTDSSGTTQPVSGTVTANQGGTWNITNISGTVSLPTGAATETSLAKLTLTQGSTTSGQSGTLQLGAVTTAAPTYTTGQSSPFSLDTTGALRVNVTAGGGSNASVSATGAAPPASATYIGASVTTAAPTYTTGQMSALSLTTGGLLRVDGSGVTQPVSGTVTANAGTGTFTVSGTVAATQSGTWTVQPGNTANTTPWLVTANAGTGNFTVIQGTAANLRAQTSSESNTGATPPTQAGLAGGSVTTAAPTYTTGQMSALSLTTAGALRTDSSSTTQPVSGTVTANQGGTWNITNISGTVSLPTGAATETTLSTRLADSTFTGRINTLGQKTMANSTPVVISSDQSALTVTGTVTATNSSVSTTGSSPPASATYIGGSVTTAAPTYTTGQMSALSLTTGGLLRVDNSSVTQPVSGTITANAGTGTFTVSGTVTANAGTGSFTVAQATAANLNATVVQSTASNLRTQTASESTTATATGTVANLVGGAVTTAAPTYTTGQMNPLSLTTTGALRTQDASAVAQASTTSGQTGQLMQGAVTTAAPTYTTGQTNPISLTTAGAIRIDGSGVTQPVSGTVAATQSGTWTVQPGNTANTTPWLTTINQGGNSAAVKPASTAAIATDPALVVAISPNNPISVSGTADTTASGTLNALNAVATISLAGQSGVGFQLAAGTLIGTIIPEISFDGGTTWIQTQFDDPNTGNKANTVVFGSNNTATARSIIIGSGTSNARVRVSAFTSGTASCSIRATQGKDPSVLFTGSTGATALPPLVGQVGGSVTTGAPTYTTGTLNSLSLTTAGALRVDDRATIDPIVTGSLTALNSTVTIPGTGNYTIGGQILGTWVGTITAEGTIDGTSWFTVRTANKSTNDIIQTYTANDQFEFYSVAGCVSLRLRMSAYTSGTANIVLAGTNLATDAFLNYSGPDGDAAPPLRHVSIASLSNDGTLHSPRNTNVDPTGTEYSWVTRDLLYGDQQSSFSPDTSSYSTATPAKLFVDDSNNLQIRGQILTDEASFRDDFSGSSLTTTLTGTVSWINASTAVTGSGTLFTTEIRVGDYIKKTADANTLFVRVMSVESDTSLTLETNYTGTTAAAASVRSYWIPTIGASGAIAVGTSNLTITTGTTSGVINSVIRRGDFGPITLRISAIISQRIANQELRIGFSDNVASLTPNIAAYVSFTGTTNTTVNFVTSSSIAVADTQTTAVTLPSGNTSTVHEYKIDVSGSQATLSIDGVVVARNTLHLPGPYDDLDLMCLAANTGVAASSTTLTIDYCYFNNVNRLQIDDDFNGEPLTIQGGSSQGQPTIVNPVLVSGSDGTNTQTFRVKPASTAAVATDPSLVVSVSPNFSADPLSTGNIAALNNAVSISMAGKNSSGFQISGTWVGTIAFEASNDNGATWFAGRASERQNAQITQTTTANGNFAFVDINGATNVRLRASAWTSGTAAVTIAATTAISDSLFNYTSVDADASPAVRFLGLGLVDAGGTFRFVRSANATPGGTEYGVITRNIPSGTQTVAQATAANLRAQTAAESTTAAAVPTVAVMAGGSDGTNLRALRVATDGTQIVSSVDGTKTTYSAAATSFVPPATPTDIFTITGSASKTVRVTRVLVTGTQTTGAIRDVLLIKRSTANTAGTSTAVTAVPLDSTNAAATATVLSYTANPTLGTAVGTIFSKKVFISGTAAAQTEQVVDFGIRNGQSVVLRGTTQVLAVNLNSVTSTGNLISVTVEWTEE